MGKPSRLPARYTFSHTVAQQSTHEPWLVDYDHVVLCVFICVLIFRVVVILPAQRGISEFQWPVSCDGEIWMLDEFHSHKKTWYNYHSCNQPCGSDLLVQNLTVSRTCIISVSSGSEEVAMVPSVCGGALLAFLVGQKAGKHEREGDAEEGSPSPKRSPKRSSKRGSKVSKSSSRESTPNPDLPTLEQEPRRSSRDIERDVQKENVKKSPTKSPPRSPPKKAKSEPKAKTPKGKSPKKAAKEPAREEPMTVDTQKMVEGEAPGSPPREQQTPVKMEQRELEPLTPLIINDLSVTNHNPQATSTPAANGVISTGVQPSSPPLSKLTLLCYPAQMSQQLILTLCRQRVKFTHTHTAVDFPQELIRVEVQL
ncbi:hypothetical protein BaRGS_00009304 [Batillaria attramentaria]|uniref:Uncharacterized protein n=1 Tax=Batillaria attramentaria TaxID=370345 RepID=A0ABD0LK54_9CAEN